MIDGLVSGKLYGKAEARTGKNDRPYVTAKVRATDGDGESVFINVVAFSDSVQAALLALDDGDSVALSGTLKARAWIDRQGEARPSLDMVAAAVLTAYHVSRKRKAVQGEGKTDQPRAGGAQQGDASHAGTAGGHGGDGGFDDPDIAF
ncbi:single-stranded DNA-binding protein [Ralstonia sp.]|uniref:single-stranded DNA-binding protein n=1 Tax=Ralstonia sp. TaxID=54061 RepID=UPI0031DAD96C